MVEDASEIKLELSNVKFNTLDAARVVKNGQCGIINSGILNKILILVA